MLRKKCFSFATRATIATIDARSRWRKRSLSAKQTLCESQMYELQPAAIAPGYKKCEDDENADGLWYFAVPKRRVTRAKKRIRKTHKFIKKNKHCNVFQVRKREAYASPVPLLLPLQRMGEV